MNTLLNWFIYIYTLNSFKWILSWWLLARGGVMHLGEGGLSDPQTLTFLKINSHRQNLPCWYLNGFQLCPIFFTYNTSEFHSFVFSTQAFVIFYWSKYSCAKQSIFFWSKSSIIYRFWFFNFSICPRFNFFRAS